MRGEEIGTSQIKTVPNWNSSKEAGHPFEFKILGHEQSMRRFQNALEDTVSSHGVAMREKPDR